LKLFNREAHDRVQKRNYRSRDNDTNPRLLADDSGHFHDIPNFDEKICKYVSFAECIILILISVHVCVARIQSKLASVAWKHTKSYISEI
jgi:hypothetical protein